jgi:DSF synthase
MRVLASEPDVTQTPNQAGSASFLDRAQHATDALRQLSEVAQSSLDLPFLSRSYSELDAALNPNEKTLWTFCRPRGRPNVTMALLRDLQDIDREIRKLFESRNAGDEQPILFYVSGSNVPGICNLGGDLPFFVDKIRHRDRESLLAYAYACIEVIYNNAYGFDLPIVTIGLVEGDALGGGLECALSLNVLIAERGTKMGFPEVLFNSFPGMGAFSFLSRKLDPVRAKKIIMSGRIYSSEEFYEMGLIDVLADKGGARDAARKFIADNKRRHSLLCATNKVQNKVTMLNKAELREVTEIWVDAVLNVDSLDLRRMEALASLQLRRMGYPASPIFPA